MIRIMLVTVVVAGVSLSAGCKRDSGGDEQPNAAKTHDAGNADAEQADHGHEHPAGVSPSAGADHAEHAPGEGDHGHEVDLGTAMFGDLKVSLAQGHGAVEAGKEGHLVVKLPYDDAGATTVRAWIGGKDRTLSYVGKGAYAPAHGDYDIHAIAPDPLPQNAMWWVEIQKPDGTRLLGSAKPIRE